jgi:hypothetical protein
MWSVKMAIHAPIRSHLLHIIPITAMVLCLVSIGPVPAIAAWQILPEVRLSGGAESDQVIDPGLNRIVIPGGSFVELGPNLVARGWIGRNTLVNTGTFAAFQQFMNDNSRRLYAHTAWGTVFRNLGRSFRGRFSASLNYFDDSERETVRRLGAASELGIMYLRSRWNAELWGSVHGRRYPELTVPISSTREEVYAEAAWSGGATLRMSPSGYAHIMTGAVLQRTDSRDDAFDSESWTLSADCDVRLLPSVYLMVSGAYQKRTFLERLQGEDEDEYIQGGVGLRYAFVPGWEASLRWGYARYKWPGGEEEDTYRLVLGIIRTWGRKNALPMPEIDFARLIRYSGESVQKPNSDGLIRFRIHSPQAKRVAIAGAFNSWDPDASLLRPAEKGWWEAAIKLAPGKYEYSYVVDGVWTTPPEAKITVDDGFGGRNGVLQVLPDGL